MSASTYEIGHAWPEVQRLLPDAVMGVNGSPFANKAGTNKSPKTVGLLSIPGVTIPEQDFSSRPTEDGEILESHPERPWPKMTIELKSRLEQSRVERLLVQASDDTVNAELLRTRIVFAIGRAAEWFLHLGNRSAKIEHQHGPSTEANEKQNLYKAKIFRKLKYIEETFGLCFSVPETISGHEVQQIETIFRGITEGRFRGRANAMSFKLQPSMIEASRPPFSGVGKFSYEVLSPVRLFNQDVPVGPFTVNLEKAELANPSVVEDIRKNSRKAIDVRLEVLDNQVIYSFEDYVKQPRRYLRQRLDKFKEQLALQEPHQLVDLLDQHIQGDVTKREATQIAVGWQFFNQLPDRFCPQEPQLDGTTGHWHVPIWLVYTSGKGGPVGEVVIDKETGEIVGNTPLDELRGKGLVLAQTILNA